MSWMVPGRLPQEGPEPRLGPGISRPRPTEATREYRLEVKRPGYRPMRVTMPAPTKAKAITYCQNRWPDSTVEFLA
jgi:hypothetical protein